MKFFKLSDSLNYYRNKRKSKIMNCTLPHMVNVYDRFANAIPISSYFFFTIYFSLFTSAFRILCAVGVLFFLYRLDCTWLVPEQYIDFISYQIQ